ncbi:MAG: hypothetical protein QOF89_3615 [Acidobacteriota bacterium]|jgi:hypothetical protein|nr:hypothetical protein [Acidobacteriota bacterium]
MTPSVRKALWSAGFAAVLLGITAGHAMLLSRPVVWLLGIVPDDAFYYLQTARHLAAGHGSTFDGIHTTSGYHPGWMILLVPLAAALPEPVSLLRAALALELLLHAATAAALIGLFRRFTSPGLAVIGALCWLVNPFALYLSLQGVESALYALSLVILLRSVLRFIAAPGPEIGLRTHVELGAALALCLLARTEAGILALVTCAVAPALRGSPFWSRSSLRSASLVATTFALGILPWFVYCWLATGSPWQSSGVVKALWAHQLLAPLSAQERLVRAAVVVGRWLAPPWIGRLDVPFEEINPFVLVAMIPAALGLLRAARRPLAVLPLIAWSAWLLGATILTGVIYGLFYWDTPDWYHAQPALVLFVLLYVWIVRTDATAGRRWNAVFGRGVPMALLLLSLFGAFAFYSDPPISYPWQRDFYNSQAEFEKRVPPGEAIGCFNAGIPAFFGHRRIINLDGLVNDSVVPYYRARKLERYFGDEGIHYLADDSYSLEYAARFMSRPIRLHPLAYVPLRDWYELGRPPPHRWLWRVEGAVAVSSP